MGKYALTYTDPDEYAWDGTNTMIIECDINLLDVGADKLAQVLADYSGYDIEIAKRIFDEGSWYIRNCADTDAIIVIEGL